MYVGLASFPPGLCSIALTGFSSSFRLFRGGGSGSGLALCNNDRLRALHVLDEGAVGGAAKGATSALDAVHDMPFLSQIVAHVFNLFAQERSGCTLIPVL